MKPNEVTRPYNSGSDTGFTAEMLEDADRDVVSQLMKAAVRTLPKGWAWRVVPDPENDKVGLWLIELSTGRKAHVQDCVLEAPDGT